MADTALQLFLQPQQCIPWLSKSDSAILATLPQDLPQIRPSPTLQAPNPPQRSHQEVENQRIQSVYQQIPNRPHRPTASRLCWKSSGLKVNLNASWINTSEENSRTCPISHQNIGFSHININMEFRIGVKIIPYALVSLLLHFTPTCYGNVDVLSALLVILNRVGTWEIFSFPYHTKKVPVLLLWEMISNQAIIDRHSPGGNFLKSIEVIPRDD